MSVKRALLHWYNRRLRVMTVVILFASIAYVLLLRKEPFEWNELRVWMFIFAHCGAMSLLLGRCTSGQDEFLFTRGFSRDALWSHRRLALLMNALLVWLSAALSIWCGLRALVQDQWVESPYYPLFAANDRWFPLAWLGGYFVCGAFWEYAVVRFVQPSRGGATGVVLLGGLLVGGMTLVMMRFPSPAVSAFTFAGLVLSTGVLVWAGRRLNRTVEVRS